MMGILDADLRRVPTEGEWNGALVPFGRALPDRSLSVDVPSRASTAVDMLVEEIAQSQPLPPIAAQVLQIAEDTKFSAHELAQAISSDPASTSLILRLANSPYYSLPCRIATVRDAVVLLGFHQVSALVVVAAVMRAFMDRGIASTDVTSPGSTSSDTTSDAMIPTTAGASAGWLLQFWRHAVAVGLVSEAMGRADRMHCNTALAAGFLHNIGLIALAQARPEAFAAAHARADAAGVSLHAAERELIGATDTEVGAALLSRWGLCPDLVAAVRDQQEVGEAFDDANLASLIARARGVVEASGLTDGVDRVRCEADMRGDTEHQPGRQSEHLSDRVSFTSVIERDALVEGEATLAQMMSRVEAFLDHAGVSCVEGTRRIC